MTQQEALHEQKLLEIKGMNMGWYFGTGCEKCCGVYPRFLKRNTTDKYHDTYYRCDVCGKQTDYFGTPAQAEEAWNNHDYLGAGVQLSFL